MGLIPGVELIELKPPDLSEEYQVKYYPHLPSNETMIAVYSPKAIEDLLVHRYQTDYWKVVRGRLIAIIFQNRQYQYIPLSEQDSFVFKIPPKVLHGAINLCKEPAVLVNAIVKHRLKKLDFHRIKPPFPYDIQAALLSQVDSSKINCDKRWE